MNIEGTKHEKAVLVVMAYIIGFTSGFIAFGVTSMGDAAPSAVPAPTNFVPADYTPPTENPPVVSENAPAGNQSEIATYEDGKLYATVKGERYVLSLHSDIMDVDNVEGFSTQGIHEALPTYSTSPDGRFVHFCEQQTTEDSCVHFIFDTERNVIQPVSKDGQRYMTTDAVAATAIWSDVGITIGSDSSADASTPWKLITLE